MLTLETVVKVEVKMEGRRSEWSQGCRQAQVWRGSRLLGRAEWYVSEEHRRSEMRGPPGKWRESTCGGIFCSVGRHGQIRACEPSIGGTI